MKFQNPSLNFFFEWTDASTDAHTDTQAESNMLPTFSKLGASLQLGKSTNLNNNPRIYDK